jgi:osmotically-inducible protein OsmY
MGSVNATDIRVQVHEGHVTLTGTVTSREQRRRAEDVADCISGVKEVTNDIRLSGDSQPLRR